MCMCMCACGCLISLDSLKFAGYYVTCASEVYCKSNHPTFQENIAFSFPPFWKLVTHHISVVQRVSQFSVW